MFSIATKEVDPVWDVPVSIQREMAAAGKPVLMRVPPGPANPLGPRWIGLTAPGVGIHGTNAPSSIFKFTTHGCIRLHSDDAVALFDLVDVETPVHLVYEPVLLTIEMGEVFLEVHSDPYRRITDLTEHTAELLRSARLETLVDTTPVQRVISERAGRAEWIASASDRAVLDLKRRTDCDRRH
jgi:L,D-transpeptidase ErfK/SrfK